MPLLEALAADVSAPLLDLSTVEATRRVSAWIGVARNIFPGLAVCMTQVEPDAGLIEQIDLGGGQLFAIRSPPVEVDFLPGPACFTLGQMISLVIQVDGSMRVRQGGLRSQLLAGDATLIDEATPFHLGSEDGCRILILRLPRQRLIARNPLVTRHCGTRLADGNVGTRMLRELLQRIYADARELSAAQLSSALAAMAELVGMALPEPDRAGAMERRIEQAQAYIEANLASTDLTPDAVARAQRISRRRLDQILCLTIGCSVSSYLWNRRLQQAADDLRDPRHEASSIAQIAFAHGFGDAAHFNRAFKRRFGSTPGHWRLR